MAAFTCMPPLPPFLKYDRQRFERYLQVGGNLPQSSPLNLSLSLQWSNHVWRVVLTSSDNLVPFFLFTFYSLFRVLRYCTNAVDAKKRTSAQLKIRLHFWPHLVVVCYMKVWGGINEPPFYFVQSVYGIKWPAIIGLLQCILW